MKLDNLLAIMDDDVQVELFTCTGRSMGTGNKADLIRYGNWFVHGIYPHNANTIDLMIDAEY